MTSAEHCTGIEKLLIQEIQPKITSFFTIQQKSDEISVLTWKQRVKMKFYELRWSFTFDLKLQNRH